MTFIAILELNFRPDALDEAHQVLARVLSETRSFPGSQGVDVVVDREVPTRWLAYERWESADADAAYRAWRAGDGKITDLAPLLAERPNLQKFDAIDV